MRTFEFRLYVNKRQGQRLIACLKDSRLLYNEMLEQAKAAYAQTGKFLFKYDLNQRFAGRGGDTIPGSTVQMLSDRLEKALKRYLSLKEQGGPGGFPRFKTPNRWHSIPLRQHQKDFRVHEDGKHLCVPGKLGLRLKIKMHRPIEGTPQTCYLVLRADGHWYALVVCAPPVPEKQEENSGTCTHPDIGLDVGLKIFLADSEGRTVANPRYYRNRHRALCRKQRLLCSRKKGSRRRQKAAHNCAKAHLKIKRQRQDFLFKVARPYAEHYAHICVENLNIGGMVQNHCLAKSIYDASWGTFIAILVDKAARAGHQVVKVNPRFTTQQCYQCGEIVQKSLSVRTHRCSFCGYIADRDVNAAQNILRAGAPPSGTMADRLSGELRSPTL